MDRVMVVGRVGVTVRVLVLLSESEIDDERDGDRLMLRVSETLRVLE